MKFQDVRQIIYNVQLTIQYTIDTIIDVVFYPIFALVDLIESIANQWKTKANSTNNNEHKQIGFNH